MAGTNARNLLLAAACVAVSACLPTTSNIAGNGGPSAPAELNTPPVITGSPTTQVMAGTTYMFQPSATDSDGDVLSFSATGLPEWASIDPQSGTVQGSPADGHAGMTSSIVVRVSDGSASTSLPAFRITVMSSQPSAPPGGSAVLTWATPTQYTDGRALPFNELLGYRVYHGPNASSLSPYHDIDGAASTAYEVRQLGPGEHCFAVTAVTVSNVESALSAVGCKQI